MKIQKPYRGETITITVTENEKAAIAEEAEKDRRTLSGFIRYKLRDVLDGVNNDKGEIRKNGEL